MEHTRTFVYDGQYTFGLEEDEITEGLSDNDLQKLKHEISNNLLDRGNLEYIVEYTNYDDVLVEIVDISLSNQKLMKIGDYVPMQLTFKAGGEVEDGFEEKFIQCLKKFFEDEASEANGIDISGLPLVFLV